MFGSKEAFICGSSKLFAHVAFRVAACVSVTKTAWMHSISPYLLVTGAHAVVSHALNNLLMGEGEKGQWDPLFRCHHIENSYHQSCRRTDRCVITPRSSSPEQLPISFKQTLLERKIFLLSHYLYRIGINGISRPRMKPKDGLILHWTPYIWYSRMIHEVLWMWCHIQLSLMHSLAVIRKLSIVLSRFCCVQVRVTFDLRFCRVFVWRIKQLPAMDTRTTGERCSATSTAKWLSIRESWSCASQTVEIIRITWPFNKHNSISYVASYTCRL